jgi:hypothetical protein
MKLKRCNSHCRMMRSKSCCAAPRRKTRPRYEEAHRTAAFFADPEAAARRPLEIANSVETVQDFRIHIEKINGPFLFEHRVSPAEYGAGLKLAIGGWRWLRAGPM